MEDRIPIGYPRSRSMSESRSKSFAGMRSRVDRSSSGYGSLSASDESSIRQSFPLRVRNSSTRESTARSPHSPKYSWYRPPPPSYEEIIYEGEISEFGGYENPENIDEEVFYTQGSQPRRSICKEIPADVVRPRPQRPVNGDFPHLILAGPPPTKDFQTVIGGQVVNYTTLGLTPTNEAKACLVDHAKKMKKIRLRSDVASKTDVYSKASHAVYRYQLRSLIEFRKIKTGTAPYTGQRVPRMTANVMSAWEYEIPLEEKPRRFRRLMKNIPIPDTEVLQSCKKCGGSKSNICPDCTGSCIKVCGRCHGYGEELMSKTDCYQCNNGYERCHKCGGSGKLQCTECDGRGKVITYKYIEVTRRDDTRRYMDGVPEVPEKHIDGAMGQIVFEERKNKLRPIPKSELLDRHIVNISKELLLYSQNIGGKVLLQEQVVDIVLVEEFECWYKEKKFSMYLLEHPKKKKVVAPEFPRKRFSFLDVF